jgi:hypothetical protein
MMHASYSKIGKRVMRRAIGKLSELGMSGLIWPVADKASPQIVREIDDLG